MLPVERAKFTGLQQSAVHWPEDLKQAAALCTSLTLVNRRAVVGDLADKQAFRAVEARFVVGLLAAADITAQQYITSPSSPPFPHPSQIYMNVHTMLLTE